jgi:hypothetical protein
MQPVQKVECEEDACIYDPRDVMTDIQNKRARTKAEERERARERESKTRRARLDGEGGSSS